MTPWVARPMRLMPLTAVRMVLPSLVMTITSSLLPDLQDADDLAVLLGDLEVDDALAAAALQAVLVDLGALAVAVLGHGQDLGLRSTISMPTTRSPALQPDAADAAGGAAHRPDVVLVEADRLALRGGQEDAAACRR